MLNMKEKRVYKRVPLGIPAKYKVLSSEQPQLLSTMINFSPQGVCFVTDSRVEEGQEIELKMQLDKKKEIKIRTLAVWTMVFKDTGQYKVGVKIIDASRADEDEFMRFYCQKVLVAPKEKMTILVVEDNEDIAKLIQSRQEYKNYNVICTYDGEDGYSKYLSDKPDLIILDLMLPKLNGFEVCRKIRREAKDTTTPILMLSAQTEDVDRIRGRVIGADKFLPRPFDHKDFFNIVQNLLAGKNPGR